MKWLKQNWIKVGLGVLILGAIVFAIWWTMRNSRQPDTIYLSPGPYGIFAGKLIRLSRDKKLTLFIRNDPRKDICDEAGCINNNEIWVKNNDTGHEKLLVKSGDVSSYSFTNSDDFPFSSISNLSSPVFSLDNKRIYFLSKAWATSDAVFYADVDTGKLYFVSDGNTLELITKGQYLGYLVVAQHRYYDPPNYGSFDHYYIITDTGREIKYLREDYNKSDFGINER